MEFDVHFTGTNEGREGVKHDAVCVDAVEAPKVFAGVGASEAFGAHHVEGAADPGADQVWNGRHVVADRHGHRHLAVELFADPTGPRLLAGMPRVPGLCFHRLTAQFAVGRGRPDLARHAEFAEPGRGSLGLRQNRAGAKQADQRSLVGFDAVQAAKDAFVSILGLRGHHEILVVRGDVVDDVLVLAVHLLHAALDDGRHLVSVGRIVSAHGRIGHGDEQGVSVLMLEAFAVERGPA